MEANPDIDIFQWLPDLDAFVLYDDVFNANYNYGSQTIFDNVVSGFHDHALYFKQFAGANLAYPDQKRRFIASFGLFWMAEPSQSAQYPARLRYRRPCPPEIRCVTWLALSRGAKGILFHYWSSPTTYSYKDERVGIDTIQDTEPYVKIPAVYWDGWGRGPGLRDCDGYPFGFGWGRDAEWYRNNPTRHRLNDGDGNTYWHLHNWDTTYTYLAQSLIPELKRLTPWLMNVTWDTAFSRDKGFFGTIFSPVRYVTACRTRGVFVGNYIDVGFFKDPADVDYFMVVNRTGIAEYDKPVRIYMEIDKEKGRDGHLYITDLYDMRVHDLRQVNNNPNNDYKFDMDFVPGQGRLYAISSDMAPAPKPPQLYAWWIPYKSSSSGPMSRINFGAPGTGLWWAKLWWNFDKQTWAFQSYDAYRNGCFLTPQGPIPGMYSFWGTDKDDINTCIDTRAGDACYPPYYLSGQQGQWRVDASVSKGGNSTTLASNIVTKTAPSSPPNPGCPTLYVRTSGSLFAQCNSILPHSEFSAAPAVDMLVLDAHPSTEGGHYYLNVSEDSTETSYFDNAKLWAVNHPQGSKVAVTTAGDILVYSDVVFPYTCYDENLASRLDEMLDPSQTYTGATGGHLELSFPDYGWEHKALLVYTGAVSENVSAQKNNQALLSTMPDTSGNWIQQGSAFTRHNPTSYLVDVSPDTSGFYRLDCDGDNVNIGCVALVKLETTGWSKQLAPLDSAVKWRLTNLGVWVSEIAGNIVLRDGNYVELNPSQQLALRFDTLASDTLIRDFVLETYGYYDPADIGGGGQSSGEEVIPFGLETERIRPLESPSLIQYSVPYETAVRIFVYDIQGRLVSRLVDSKVPAGYHKVAWSDTDDANRKLGAGVYFVRMTASGFRDCKKVVLLKGD